MSGKEQYFFIPLGSTFHPVDGDALMFHCGYVSKGYPSEEAVAEAVRSFPNKDGQTAFIIFKGSMVTTCTQPNGLLPMVISIEDP